MEASWAFMGPSWGLLGDLGVRRRIWALENPHESCPGRPPVGRRWRRRGADLLRAPLAPYSEVARTTVGSSNLSGRYQGPRFRIRGVPMASLAGLWSIELWVCGAGTTEQKIWRAVFKYRACVPQPEELLACRRRRPSARGQTGTFGFTRETLYNVTSARESYRRASSTEFHRRAGSRIRSSRRQGAAGETPAGVIVGADRARNTAGHARAARRTCPYVLSRSTPPASTMRSARTA